MRWLHAMVIAVTCAGCMNVTFSQMVEEPGPHDNVITVIALGSIGDLGLAAAGAGVHAESSQELAFEDVILFYALPLLVVDAVVAIIRIDKYRN